MLNNATYYKIFIISLLASSFLVYFTSLSMVAYAPIILTLLFLIIIELIKPLPLKYKDWITVLLWLPYVLLATSYYILNPYNGNILSSYFLAILSIPFIILSFLRLKYFLGPVNYTSFIYKLVFYFCLLQLIICLGQLSTYLFGFGLPVNKDYAYMITGTFNNSNDLAACVLLLSFIFTRVEKISMTKINIAIWLLIISLLVITSSRSALFITGLIFILTRRLNAINTIRNLLFFFGLFFIYNNFLLTNNSEIFLRITERLNTISLIMEDGLESDGSISLRTKSYMHFLKNLDRLGLGSGEINNYYKYADNANFSTGLMFQNPHSLIVEIGYWLGIPGLIAFTVPFLYMFRYSNNIILLLLAVGISSTIPSSILANPTYFVFIILCFLANSNKRVS